MRARGAWPMAIAAALAACGNDPARVQIVGTSACGHVDGASSMNVIAYHAGGDVTDIVAPGQAAPLANFPADTEQLGIQILDGGGAIAAIGKTAPFGDPAFADLPEGATLPVFIAPEDGFCAVGDLGAPRSHPLVARAGTGVLVVGGGDATAEWYDPATAAFVPVAVPAGAIDGETGLVGGVLTTLPDGRAVLSGTGRSAVAIFDPVEHAFDNAQGIDPRAFHGAIAVDDDHLLVAGGCTDVGSGGDCEGVTLLSSFVYDLTDLTRVSGPNLPVDAKRIGATMFDAGDGFWLAGGSGTPGDADRYDLAKPDTTTVHGLHATPALLDGGGLLTADASGTGLVAAGGDTAFDPASAPASDGALVTLEDGRVASFGAADGTVGIYDPTTQVWTSLPAAGGPASLAGTTAIRLADGSVLVLGGDTASASAFVFRPSLIGPSAGVSLVVATGGGNTSFTAADPAAFDPTGKILTADARDLGARLLVGGTRTELGSVVAAVHEASGGVALIAQQTAPGKALVARLVPGQAATIERLGAGTLCTGPMVGTLGERLELDVDASGATVRSDNQPLFHCTLDGGGERGAWGVAVVGGQVQIESVGVTR